MASPIPKARFFNEREIIKAIDAKIAEISRLRVSATSLYNEARAVFEKFKKHPDRPELLVKRDVLIDRGDRKMSKADRIESGYLRQLKGKLAVFRTGMFPALDDGDSSVPK